MWTPDGHIVFLADARGESYLCAVPVDGGEVRRIAGGGLQLSAATFDSTARRAAVVATTPVSPGEIALIETATGTQTQLTSYNRSYLDKHPPARLEKSTLSRGGVEIESRVWLPPDFDPSQQYPMVLDIHGGPHGVFADAFNPVQQVLATAGYVVLAVNPRGSSTYGVDFVKAVLGDWGGEDYLDIMAAVDEVTARPYIDPRRLGITGYSYGGYMSSWIVGHDSRFKAAVVGAPCTDLYSMYGTSDIGVWFGELNWHAKPWESPDKALERSPITYAPNVETPVLLMHGEDDDRCPIGQSEEYFVALKRLGKEVEFVRFPGSSHMFLRGGHPRLREEYLARTLAWFDRHLGGV
jgi:dipeptidyl aminopeptidase/acylaminoacyl peptidase